jgi:uncharacterized Tic20 family protein
MAEGNEKDARQWAMFCHLAALCAYVGIPFGHIIGPLIVWQMKKKDFPLVDEQGKEAVNFQLSMTIYMIISAILILVIVGFFLLAILGLLDLILTIVAAVKANNGVPYRYPFTIRFIK